MGEAKMEESKTAVAAKPWMGRIRFIGRMKTISCLPRSQAPALECNCLGSFSFENAPQQSGQTFTTLLFRPASPASRLGTSRCLAGLRDLPESPVLLCQ